MGDEKMDVPFKIQHGDLSDEDYAALSRYYSQPYYDRDASEIEHIREYDWVKAGFEGNESKSKDEVNPRLPSD